MAPPVGWWTGHRWATRGSKLQTQLYVNRQRQTLTKKVLGALPTLATRDPRVEWVAPREENGFGEPRDRSMLKALELEHLAPALAAFWPARGPVWDALAICRFPNGGTGVILAEGKNYPREMYSGGTGAGKSGSEASLASRRKIESAIAWAQGRLGVPLDVERWIYALDPAKPRLSLYQTANRLTYAVWLQSQGTRGFAIFSSSTTGSTTQQANPIGRRLWIRRTASSASMVSSSPLPATPSSKRSIQSGS